MELETIIEGGKNITHDKQHYFLRNDKQQ